MTSIQTINLTQLNWSIPAVIHSVQNDTGRTLKMVIDDTTIEAGDTASVSIHRPDDSFYTVNATKAAGENAFKFDMTQALTQEGTVECQLKVTSSEKIVSTYTFHVIVQKSTDGYSEEQYGHTVDEIMDAIDGVADYVDELQDIRKSYDGTEYPKAGDAVRTQVVNAIIQGGITDSAKEALLNALAHVAWIDEHGQDYYNELEDALYPPTSILYITAEFDQGTAVIYDSDSLDSLKQYMTVTAFFNNGNSAEVTSYTLSGTLAPGTSRIMVEYEGRSTKISVQVTRTPGTIAVVNNLTNATTSNPATSIQEGDSYSATITVDSGFMISSVLIRMGSLDITSTAYSNGNIYIEEVTDNLEITVVAVAVTVLSITATYTQSGTVYDTDTLDSLKADLVVTASWSDGTTTTIADSDYTLSGTLTEGTSTITVSYGGKTTTFSVTVISSLYPLQSGSHSFTSSGHAVEVSNGKHVKFSVGATGGGYQIVNLSNLTINGTNASQSANTEAVNNLATTIFTIPANAMVTLSMENVSLTKAEFCQTNVGQMLVAMRKTNTSTSAFNGVGFVTNASDRMTVNEIVSNETDVSCVFLYIAESKANVSIEFDISLIVNGEKWI